LIDFLFSLFSLTFRESGTHGWSIRTVEYPDLIIYVPLIVIALFFLGKMAMKKN